MPEHFVKLGGRAPKLTLRTLTTSTGSGAALTCTLCTMERIHKVTCVLLDRTLSVTER